MPSSSRGAGRQKGEKAVADYVRTLDVYAVNATHKSPSPPPRPRALPAESADAAVPPLSSSAHLASAPPFQRQPQQNSRFGAHHVARSGLAASKPGPSPALAAEDSNTFTSPPPPRVVTEDDYRLTPEQVQQRVQAALTEQVRTLLEARLRQRLRQARLAEAERAAQERQAAMPPRQPPAPAPTAAAAASALSAGALPAAEREDSLENRIAGQQDGGAGCGVAGADPTREETPPAFTTSRLVGVTEPVAAPTAPPADPRRYAETLNAYPYSAVELVRVHRLRGVPDHNRGLFAGLARRSFTTRSGHLVINPDLDGKPRVRPAVSGHVWTAQHADPHPGLRLDGMVLSVASADSSQLRPSTGSRVPPPRLVMKVVGDGAHASFVWTEESSSRNISSRDGKTTNASASAPSADSPLSAALLEVLDRKYGKGLTEQEKKEAERRLRERRRREGQEDKGADTSASRSSHDVTKGQRKQRDETGASAAEGDGVSALPAQEGGRASADGRPSSGLDLSLRDPSGAVSSDGASGGGEHASSTSSATSPHKGPAIIHSLLPVVLDKDSVDSGPAAVAEPSRTSTRLPPELASGAEPPNNSLNVSHHNNHRHGHELQGRPDASAGSKVGLSVSDLEHTMSVNEAKERQRDRQTRAEQAEELAKTGSTAPTGSGQKTHNQNTAAAAGASSAAFGGSHAHDVPRRDSAQRPHAAATGSPITAVPSSTFGKTHTGGGGTSPHSTSLAMDLAAELEELMAPGGTKNSAATTTGTAAAAGAAVAASSGGAAASSQASPSGGASLFPIKAPRNKQKNPASGVLGSPSGTPKVDKEKEQIDTFFEHFPEAESHVKLRREAKNILDELEDLWDDDGSLSEHQFPLPQFASQEFNVYTSSDFANDAGDADGAGGGGDGRAAARGSDEGSDSEEPPEEAVTGFEVDVEALQAKFRLEALEDCADLVAKRDALLAEVMAQRQLIRDFGDDVHFLSVGSAHGELTAEQYAIELTRDVNAYARLNHLRFNRAVDEDLMTSTAKMEAEEEARVTMGFLERFGLERVPMRDAGTQVSDADLCYVDAAVRSTEAQLESLFHHEKALLNAVRLATVAVANILSFHASLEMESTCHECFYVFDKPRTLWPCGHTFCHACLSTMYNARGDLICAECGSVCEVGYTPNMPMELIANYQTVYTRSDEETTAVGNGGLTAEKDAQTIEGVLRSLLSDLLSTQHNWKPSAPATDPVS